MTQEYYDPWSNTKTVNGLDADLVISALQKCIRRAEEDTALRMAYELYMTSTFHEEKMWNRLLVISVEDIGFGNEQAPIFVKTMYDLHKEYAYKDGDRPIFFMHAIRYLCKSQKERSTDHIKNIIMRNLTPVTFRRFRITPLICIPFREEQEAETYSISWMKQARFSRSGMATMTHTA